MPTKARDGADSGGRISAESGAEDLPLSGPAEGAAGAHSARTSGPAAAGKSRGFDETHRAVHQRAKAKDGIGRDARGVAELRQRLAGQSSSKLQKIKI